MHDISWAGIAFWVGVFTWFSVTAWTRYLGERERQRTLRAYAERGTQPDSATMEKLLPTPPAWMPHPILMSEEKQTRDLVRGLTIGGIVTMSAGVGLLLGAQLLGRIQPQALIGMSVGGSISLCVGLGLLIAALIVRRQAGPGMAGPAGVTADVGRPDDGHR